MNRLFRFAGVCTGASVLAAPAIAQQPTPISTPSQSVPTQTRQSQPAPDNPVTAPPSPRQASTLEVDLRPHFKAGQQIRYVFDQTAHNTLKSLDQSDNSMDQDNKQTERIGLLMRVTEGNDQGATIQVVYESIKISLTTPEGPAEYDSAKPAAPKTTKPATPAKPSTTTPSRPTKQTKPGTPATPQTPATPDPDAPPAIPDALKNFGDLDTGKMLQMLVGPMVGTTITVKTDASGAMTSVTGGDALGGGGLGGLGGMGGALVPSPSQMANWLVAGVGGPSGKSTARVGESWTNNDSMSGTPVGSFRMVTTHTLKSAFGGAANLAFTGHIEPPSETASAPAAGAQVQNAMYTGTYVWNTREGSLTEMSSDMKVSMDGAFVGSKSRMSSETQVKVRRQDKAFGDK